MVFSTAPRNPRGWPMQPVKGSQINYRNGDGNATGNLPPLQSQFGGNLLPARKLACCDAHRANFPIPPGLPELVIAAASPESSGPQFQIGDEFFHFPRGGSLLLVRAVLRKGARWRGPLGPAAIGTRWLRFLLTRMARPGGA